MTARGYRFAGFALTAAIALGGASTACAAGEKFVLISHAADSDSWWNTVKNALQQAGEDFEVTVDYRHPANGDQAGMAQLIDRAAAGHCDGVIATIGDAGVQRALQRVVAKKIPLITINSGTQQQSEQLGAIMHVGQPEYEAGRGAGVRARATGVKSFVCVNTFSQSPASFERCRGFADAIGIADYRASTLVAGADASGVDSKLGAYLRGKPDTQAVLALGPDGAAATLRVLEKLGLKGKIWFAGFDLSDDISRAIKDGSMKFSIDQQPYLQGYIPVAVMTIMQREKTSDPEQVMARLRDNPKFQKRLADYGLTPLYGPRHISSGPGFVTGRNIDKVEKYAGRYR
ncbi:MAG TPA: sugar ABC transporter substrate-binding protein [Gallionella sp.]|nr:sugar ABC transporter substrate-binding protein [Gallionella sp.]